MSCEELIEYRLFLEKISSNQTQKGLYDDILLTKALPYELTDVELTAEFINCSLNHLIQLKCPQKLLAPIVKNVVQIFQSKSEEYLELRNSNSNSKTFNPSILKQLATTYIKNFCQRLLDNIELNKILSSTSDSTNLNETPTNISDAVKNSRRYMEDRHICIDDFTETYNIENCGKACFYGVFDGHDGVNAATYASTQLPNILAAQKYLSFQPEVALRQAFLETDNNFLKKSIKGGTTAVCALYFPEALRLYVGWVGDSKALLVKQGKILQIVKSHKPEDPNEQKRIIEAGGTVMKWEGQWRVNGLINLSRAIGDIRFKPHITAEPDIVVIELDKNEDFLVLGCDGLWDHVEEEQVAFTVYESLREDYENLERIPELLIEKAKSGGSLDNITVIVVFFKHPCQIAKSSTSVGIMDSAVHEYNSGEEYTSDQVFDATSNAQTDPQSDQAKNFFNENQQVFQKEFSPKLDTLNDSQVKQQINNGLNNFIQDLTDSTIPMSFNNQNDINNEYDNNNKLDNNEKHNIEYLHDEILDNEYTTEIKSVKEGHVNDLGPETCVDFATEASLITENCESSLDPSTAPLEYISPLENKNDILDPNHNDFFKNQHPEKINENSNQLFSPDSEEVINQFSDDTMNMLSSDDQHTEPLSLEQQSLNNDGADLLNKDLIGEIIEENEILKEFNDNLQHTNGYTNSNVNDFNANEIGNLEDFEVSQNLENQDQITSDEIIIEKNQELNDRLIQQEILATGDDHFVNQTQSELSEDRVNEDYLNDGQEFNEKIEMKYIDIDHLEENKECDVIIDDNKSTYQNDDLTTSEAHSDVEHISLSNENNQEDECEKVINEESEKREIDTKQSESKDNMDDSAINMDHLEQIKVAECDVIINDNKDAYENDGLIASETYNDVESISLRNENHQGNDECEKIINEKNEDRKTDVEELELNEKFDSSVIEIAECEVINNDNKAVYQNDEFLAPEAHSGEERISLSNENLVENNFSIKNIQNQENLEYQEKIENDNQTSQIQNESSKTIETVVENVLKEDLEQNIKPHPGIDQVMESTETKMDKNLISVDGKHLQAPPNEKCDESDDEWNYIDIKEVEGEKQETENSEKGIINSSLDKLLIEQSSAEKDNEETEKHEESDHKNQNEILTRNLDIIDFEKIAATDDMNYQLNPDAKEFIPTSPPDFATLTNGYPKLQQRLEDDVVAQSPRKASVNMDDIQVPEEETFDKEAAARPHEVAEELIIPEQSPIPCGIMCGDERRQVCGEPMNEQETIFDICTGKENNGLNSVVTTTANADPLVGFSPVAELDNIDMNRSIYIENLSSKTEKDESDLLNSVQTIPDEIENGNEVMVTETINIVPISNDDFVKQCDINNVLQTSNNEVEELNLDKVVEDINKLNINSEEKSLFVEQQIEEKSSVVEQIEKKLSEQMDEPLVTVKNDVEVSNNSEEIIDIASAAVATAAVVAIAAAAEKSKSLKSPTSGAPKVVDVKKSLSKTTSDSKKTLSATKDSQKKFTPTTASKPKTMTVAATQPPKTITISPPKRPQTAPVKSTVLNDKKLGTQTATKTSARPQSAGLTKKVTSTTTNKIPSETNTLKAPATTRSVPNKNAVETKSTGTKSSPNTLKSKTIKSPVNGVATNAAPKTLLVNKTTSTTNKTSTFKAAPPRTITSSAPTKTETNKSPTTKTVTKITSRPIASAPRTIGVTKRAPSSTTTTTSKPSETALKKLESSTTTVKKTITSTVTNAIKKSAKPTVPISSTTTKKTVSTSATTKSSPSKNQTNKAVGKLSEKKIVENETQLINNIETNNIPLEVVEKTPNLSNGDNNCVKEIIKEDILA